MAEIGSISFGVYLEINCKSIPISQIISPLVVCRFKNSEFQGPGSVHTTEVKILPYRPTRLGQ